MENHQKKDIIMAKSKSPKSTAIDILDNSYLSASLQGKLVKHAIACDGCSLRTLGAHSRWSEIAKAVPSVGNKAAE